uniref:(northern house mosquito) hypothetical protein n=1 Tax=Culex pipiens TaxID=7175 RepID=A0A8D8CRD7_CULPI
MSGPTANNTVCNDSRVTFAETKEFTFTWTIPDFNAWFSQMGSWALSPRCPSPGSGNTTQWVMKFCRESKDGKAFCSLFLQLEACPEPTLNAKKLQLHKA